MSAPSHYEILGIPATSSASEIKAAYRKLAFEYHPDRNQSESAAERFFQINSAYEALIDPIRRASYDRLQAMTRDRVPSAPRPQTPPTKPAGQTRPQPKPKPSSEPEPEPEPAPKPPTRANPEEVVRLTGLLTRGRFAEAERIARKMIASNVQHAIPYAVMGDIARMRGELQYAVEMYAYAVQIDSRNAVYQRKHDEVSHMLTSGSRRIPILQPDQQNDSGAMLVATFVVMIAATYLVMSKERAISPDMALLSTWTWSLISMLSLCGVVLGSCLSFAGSIGRFASTMGRGSVAPVSPGVLVGLMAALNFWLATALYCLFGGIQRTFDLTASRLIVGVGLVTLLLTGASAAHGTIDPLQTFLWGGNLVYMGTLLGWLVTDAYLEESGRVK